MCNHDITDNNVRSFQTQDWNEVKCIYQQGIDTNIATFETSCPTWEKWSDMHLKECRFVYVLNSKVVGWVALTPTSSRCVYAGVAEVSVYVANDAKRKGIGSALLKRLIESSEANGIWTLQSGVIEENTASIELHKKCGFRVVGIREKISQDRFGVWKNIVLMERRSKSDDFKCRG